METINQINENKIQKIDGTHQVVFKNFKYDWHRDNFDKTQDVYRCVKRCKYKCLGEIYVSSKSSEIILVTEHQCQKFTDSELKLSRKEEIKKYIEKTGVHKAKQIAEALNKNLSEEQKSDPTLVITTKHVAAIRKTFYRPNIESIEDLNVPHIQQQLTMVNFCNIFTSNLHS